MNRLKTNHWMWATWIPHSATVVLFQIAGSMPSAGCPVQNNITRSSDAIAQGSSCPVIASDAAGSTNPLNNMPSGNNAPHPTQTQALSTLRQSSSIPMGDTSHLPPHQQGSLPSGDGAIWNYPSEQMFYNAMKRKVCAQPPPAILFPTINSTFFGHFYPINSFLDEINK